MIAQSCEGHIYKKERSTMEQRVRYPDCWSLAWVEFQKTQTFSLTNGLFGLFIFLDNSGWLWSASPLVAGALSCFSLHSNRAYLHCPQKTSFTLSGESYFHPLTNTPSLCPSILWPSLAQSSHILYIQHQRQFSFWLKRGDFLQKHPFQFGPC